MQLQDSICNGRGSRDDWVEAFGGCMAAFIRLVLTVSLLILIPGGKVTAMDTEVCGTYFISSEKFRPKIDTERS